MDNTQHTTSPRLTMRLTGIGVVPAAPASEIRIGDTLIWNYNYRYRVLDIQLHGAKSAKVTEQREISGELIGAPTVRTLRLDRLVCIQRVMHESLTRKDI